MRKFSKALFVAILLFMIPIPMNAALSESEVDNRDYVLQFLQEAFDAQVSLSEKERSREQIEDILSPYLFDTYMEIFLNENLFELDGKFITYGSDTAVYYIPFFQYSDETKLSKYEEKLYVYEFFPKNEEGPVGYESHYEGVVLEKAEEGWKVSEYLYDNIPKQVLDLDNESTKHLSSTEEFFLFPMYLYNRFIKHTPIDMFLLRFL